MTKARSNTYVYSSTRICGLIFENEKTVQPESTRATRKTYLTHTYFEVHYSAIDANTTCLFFLIFVHVTFLRVLYNIHHHIAFAEELELKKNTEQDQPAIRSAVAAAAAAEARAAEASSSSSRGTRSRQQQQKQQQKQQQQQ